MSTLIGLGLLYALTRTRGVVSHSALTSLGAITDSRHITLEPASLLPDVEITSVEILEDPVVVGNFAKVWIHLKANAQSPQVGDFCRIYDNDTEVLVGVKKNWGMWPAYIAPGDEWVAKYDGIDDWNTTMPNRTWNLRIEVGTN